MKTVACLGLPASYAHVAAQKFFISDYEPTSMVNIAKIFDAVENETVDYGVIPVENSLTGSIFDNYELLFTRDIHVVGEEYVKVHHHLLGLESGIPASERIKNLSKVVDHYRPLGQCSKFFETHSHIKQEVFPDTESTAKFVLDQDDPFLATIGSKEKAEHYHLTILAEDIQDNPEHYIRYLIIAKEQEDIDEANACSIIYTTAHTPGSLYKGLQVLAENELNLIKIESRSIPGKPFEYMFYADMEWQGKNAKEVQKILQSSFMEKTQTLKILGFYQSTKATIA